MSEKNQFKNEFELLYIDHAIRNPQWQSYSHTHPFTEIFYVTKGEGQLIVNDKETYIIKEDDLIIINPYVLHTEKMIEDKYFEYIVFGVKNVIAETEDQEKGLFIGNFNEYKHEVLLYLKVILNENNNPDSFSKMVSQSLLQVLIMNIIRRNKVNLNVKSVENNRNKDAIFIKNYLEENSHKNITLDHLAEISYLDKYYLSHLFKKNFAIAPIEYLTNIRIDKAKKLLKTTDFTIAQISSMLGFSNPAYFSQFFKKKLEISPSDYRKRVENDK